MLHSYPSFDLQVEIQNVHEPSKKETLRAKYVVGADGKHNFCSDRILWTQVLIRHYLGAHSWVRKALDIQAVGDHTGELLNA